MIPITRSLLLLSLSLALGVAHIGDTFAQVPAPAPPRGQLIENPPQKLGSYTVADLLGRIADGTVTQWLITQSTAQECTVDVYQIRYGTIGSAGEPTTASGALMIPSGTPANCQGPRPIAMYAHGKRNLESINIADLDGDAEGVMIALSLASAGYVVIAPNYAGYDTSTLPYHPFLHAAQQSADMMDALAAARAALAGTAVTDNGRLFITGYSQGGHVAMATHRAMQAAGMTVTASAPMSGPYAMSAFADAVFMGQVGKGSVEEFAMLASSYQHAYGNLFAAPAEMFEPQYVGAPDLFPSTVSGDNLVAQGSLPPDALFNDTPPSAELAPMTPATEPREFAAVFALGFGPDHLITNGYRQAYLQDAAAAPDEGFPDTTSGLPPANPAHPLRQALKDNDLRNWSPVAPVQLCGGSDDPVVFFFNTELIQGYWAANAPGSQVTTLDVDLAPSAEGPFPEIRQRFAQAKRLIGTISVIDGAKDGGRSAVLENYHDVLVPAFCMQATRSFFDQLAAAP